MRKGLWICLLLAFPLICSAANENFLPLRTDVQSERPEVAILQHSPDQVVMEIKLPGLIMSEGTLEGRRWDRVQIVGGYQGCDLGAPEVPHFTRLLIIPATKGVRAEFEALETTTLDNIELMPYQQFQPDEPIPAGEQVRYDMAAYSLNSLYPQDPVMVGEPAVMRGLRVVTLRTNPVQYNPVTKELRVVTRYRINVHFEGTDLRGAPTRQIPLSRTWGNLMRGVSFNFDDSEIDEQDMGSYLILCQTNSVLQGYLQPLIEWKNRKGHSVTLQTFASGSSNSTIKNLIQTAYNTWPVPPEYVLLVGDVDGSYALAGWSISGYMLDHPYSQLEGGDILADVAVGRMSGSTATQIQTMVNKVIFYERTPYTTSSAWFAHSVLAAGYSGSSYSMYQTSRWIKTRMLWAGYTQVDTVFYSQYPGSMSSQTITRINNGVTYYNYRGWISQSLSISQINALTNGRKLPFATILTCDTGGFNGSSEMETYLTAGTPTTPAGGIASVGLATLSTHINFNNTLDMGIYAGLFEEGITQAGTSVNRGKLELYNAYQQNDPSQVSNFSNWCALAGDPGIELFTGAIQYMTCSVPDQITLGQNSVALTVNQQGGPALEGATVCAYKAGELQSVGMTDANGQVTLPLSVAGAGNVKVTITKHNYFPIVDSLDVVQAEVVVGYLSSTIDDDNSGGSSGDNDGIINPGEIVQIPSVFKNYGTTTTATNISVTASETDPFVTLANATQTFPDLAPGATGNSSGSFLLTVANDAANEHIIPLGLNAASSQGSWPGLLNLNVVSYDITLQSTQATGFSPGATANLVLNIRNNGNKNAASLTATLTSLSSFVTVVDNSASFGTVNIGATANCSGNPFTVTALGNTPPGTLANLRVVYSANGATQVDTFSVAVGNKSLTDPQGPDAYGYYCFDNTDLNYAQHPTYSWVEIDPGYGGSGTQLPLTDGSEGQDQSTLVNLPFTFRFYGQTTNQITVCSNGWISTTPDVSYTDFRNYPIPSPIGPSGHICTFWDDLITSPGHVFSWNDAANHRFIVEWSRMYVLQTTSQQVVQVILYDPAYYTTPTQDGEIVFQYNVVNDVYGNNGNDNPYSTVGIESPDRQTGIEVVYWNTYNDPAAAHLQNGRAYKFTTAFTYQPSGSGVDITLTPTSPPIQIPAGGGSFNFDVTIHNTGASPAAFDGWIMQKLPNGTWQGPMIGPVNLILAAGGTIQRNRNQNVPGSAAAGTYYYTGYVGVYSSVKWDSSYFTYTKLAAGDGGSLVNNWDNWGDSFAPWMTAEGTTPIASVPQEFALRDAYPNPFNPAATLTFELPQASFVRLDVFDLQGRKVAELVNGMRVAGIHHAVWDASGQASGLYFYRMKAGEFNSVGKMMLVK